MKSAVTLIVYAYSSFVASWGPGPELARLFEKECACQVKYVDVGDGGSLLNRLKIEGEKSPADLIIGLDDATLLRAKREISRLKNDVKFDSSPYAFVYDSKVVSHPPKSLDDLLAPQWKGQIILEDPRLSTPGLGFLLWVIKEKGEDGAWVYLKKLKDQVKIVAPSWDMAYGLFKKGQAQLVFSYWTSPAYHIQEENRHDIKAAEFTGGNYVANEYLASLQTQNEKLATAFQNFLLGEKAQHLFPVKNFMYPVNPKASLTAAFKEIGESKRLPPLKVKAEDLEKWLKKWQELWRS